MALTAQATAVVSARPQDILEFVLDLERYRKIDSKIVRSWGRRGPDQYGRGSVKMIGRMRWLPPTPDKLNFELERWTEVRFVGAPRQPARMIFDFLGVVTVAVSVDASSEVTHRYDIRFKGPFRVFERRLQPWLQRQIDEEVRDLAAQFDTGKEPARGDQG